MNSPSKKYYIVEHSGYTNERRSAPYTSRTEAETATRRLYSHKELAELSIHILCVLPDGTETYDSLEIV